MREDTEVRWIIDLLLSKYTQRLINQKSASISELERVAGCGEKNTRFRKWVKTMMSKNCFKIYKKNGLDTYVIDFDKFIEYAKENNELFKKVYKIVIEYHYSL